VPAKVERRRVGYGQLLQETGRKAGVACFVFVSSQSARADAPNIYGGLKWQTEEALKGDGVISGLDHEWGFKSFAATGLVSSDLSIGVKPIAVPRPLSWIVSQEKSTFRGKIARCLRRAVAHR
jgi:hypothetical protein